MNFIDWIYKKTAYLNQTCYVVRFQQFCGIQSNFQSVESECYPTMRYEISNDHGSKMKDMKPKNEFINSNITNLDRYGRNDNSYSCQKACFDRRTANCNSSKKTDVKTPDYIINNKLFQYLFYFGSSLCSELFFITFFPFCLWNCDSFVSRRLCIVWWITMYIGQASKDIIRWERPKCPPVVRLEKQYETEYSMPSTHAMSGACIPFSLLAITVARYEVSLILCLVLAVIWCSLVACSRLYLGMHTVLDVLAGLLLAAALVSILVPLSHHIDWYTTTHPLAIITSPLLIVLLSHFYPADRWSTAIGDTVMMISVGGGIAVGSWLNWHLGFLVPSPDTNTGRLVITAPSSHDLCLALARFAVGLCVLVGTRALVKPASRALITKWYTRNPGLSDRVSETHPVPLKVSETRPVSLKVELWYKLITYMAVAANAVFTAPLIFTLLNVHREGYYSEI